MSSQMVSLYVLIDPRNLSVFYVGQTINPDSRYTQHLSDRNNQKKFEIIRALRELGLLPVMEVIDVLPANQINAAERSWIFYLGRFFRLTNVASGGGYKSEVIRESARKKISRANRGKKKRPAKKVRETNTGKRRRKRMSMAGECLKAYYDAKPMKALKANLAKKQPSNKEPLTVSEALRAHLSKKKAA